MSDMSPELIGIISASASLAALLIGLFAWLRQDMKDQGQRFSRELAEQGQRHSRELAEQGQRHSKEIEAVKTEIEAVKKEVDVVKKEVGGVKIEVASLKATVETYFRVRVDPPPTAAVAEPPEDYGAD